MKTVDDARAEILLHLDLLHGGDDADHMNDLMDHLVDAVQGGLGVSDVAGARVDILQHLDLLYGGDDADHMDDLLGDLVAAARAAA
ncbi:hypothetical protein [Streptomyces filamentosus]|uniref:hypothetical protein n=1 Tax=Streptomyces filamentosus TaxID=67294 RepID=UPI0033DE99D8